MLFREGSGPDPQRGDREASRGHYGADSDPGRAAHERRGEDVRALKRPRDTEERDDDTDGDQEGTHVPRSFRGLDKVSPQMTAQRRRSRSSVVSRPQS